MQNFSLYSVLSAYISAAIFIATARPTEEPKNTDGGGLFF